MRRLALLAALLLAIGAVSERRTHAAGYLYHRSITVDHLQVGSGNSTGFPLLVKATLGASRITDAQCDDVIFATDVSGATLVPWEIETCDTSTGAIVAWVYVATLSASVDNILYVLYGNAAITTAQNTGGNAPTAVWDSNFKGVWHLPNGSSLTTNDSTSNGNNGTATSVDATTGNIDGGGLFNASGDKVTISNTISVTNYTVSAWFKTSNGNQSTFRVIANKQSSGATTRNYWLGLSNGGGGFGGAGSVILFQSVGGVSKATVQSGTRYDDDSWHYAVGVYDGTNMRVYVDGGSSASLAAGNPDTQTASTVLGDDNNAADRWPGSLDEIRVSNVARSADWITADWNNGKPGATMVTVGSEVVRVAVRHGLVGL